MRDLTMQLLLQNHSTLPATCDNNPNVAFRIVSIFNPSGANTAYASSSRRWIQRQAMERWQVR